MNVNQIVRIIPTLKVNNRKLNETFYIGTLGMKALLEESAFLSLGDQTGLEKLVLEEAPSMRTRKVEGRKKLARLIVKVENPLEIEELLYEKAMEIYKEKQEQLNGDNQMLEFEKVVILRVVDRKWTDHIDDMDQLRQSVGLRGYAQIDPLTEYQTEGYERFQQMIAEIDYDVTRILMKSQIRQNLQRSPRYLPNPELSGGLLCFPFPASSDMTAMELLKSLELLPVSMLSLRALSSFSILTLLHSCLNLLFFSLRCELSCTLRLIAIYPKMIATRTAMIQIKISVRFKTSSLFYVLDIKKYFLLCRCRIVKFFYCAF